MSRVPVAVVAGILGLLLYVMAVVALADAVVPRPWAVQLVFYAAAGVAWVWPMQKLMFWGARKP